MASIRPISAFGWMLPETEHLMYPDSTYNTDKFHASSFVDCGRMLGHRLLGTPKSDPGFNLQYKRAAEQGNIIHDYVQKMMVASGKVAQVPDFNSDKAIRSAARKRGATMPAVEVPFRDYTLSKDMWRDAQRYFITGKCDIQLQGRDGLMIGEIKSVDKKYLMGDYSRYLPSMLEHYETQCQLYMHFFECKSALVQVINRDNFFLWLNGEPITWEDPGFGEFVMREYICDYNPEFIVAELERLERMHFLLERNELPEPEPGRGICRFCNWNSVCPLPKKERKTN